LNDLSRPLFASVAAPVPLANAFTYRVPPDLVDGLAPGCRVRVPLGRRKVVGVVLDVGVEPPAGVEMRDIEELLDQEPVLPADLLELARFVADYYVAPLGDVLRSFLPAKLPSWGAQKVWLTDAGAVAPPRGEGEAAIVDALLASGPARVAVLRRSVARGDFASSLLALRSAGRVASAEDRARGGARYQTAVELAPLAREERQALARRSKPAAAVFEYLESVGRPATLEEIAAETGASGAVVRRLTTGGALRRFVQVEKLDLRRHELTARGEVALTLRIDQASAVTALSAALDGERYAGFLLHGITGSGKTEVYLRAIDHCRRQGRSAIVLVPEIGLVPALAAELRRRFDDDLAVFHSALGSGERHQEWERVRRGEAHVVLGPRSALFAPVERLGLVVVDEEQDAAFKQDSSPRYHGRDLAFVRASQANAALLLASATPSLESRLNVERGRLVRLELRGRAGAGRVPEGILVDLREEGRGARPGETSFSRRLVDELRATFERGEQAILLRNRRGFAPTLLCRACGEDFRCENCGLPRTLHKRKESLVCHYCGSHREVPKACPTCDREVLEPIGSGTERVEEEFRELFPRVAVSVLDRDAVQRAGGAAAVLERFATGEAQALIGTQMVSKGHHFPRVALAAVLGADGYLGFPDFRAVERTYSLLTQLAGRAGRSETAGKVLVQTFHPDHYAIRAALENDDAGFAREEMRFRRVFHYPPYTRMVLVASRDPDRAAAEGALVDFGRRLREQTLPPDARVQGPGPAPFERLRGEWRFQLIVRSRQGGELRRAVRAALAGGNARGLTVDVDPQALL
jgi:primosomal protein N' (replication factor Y)